MCNNCTHKVVCSIYRATGGKKQCEHHKEERKGRWLYVCNAAVECSCCSAINAMLTEYCPDCGADMRGEEDG